jgi:sialate O-acetylesterase
LTKISVSSPRVPDPVHFRCAWGRNPMANLQSADRNDLPFATQRSEDWKVENIPLGVLGGEPFPGGKMTRGQRGKILQVLRKQDLWRRVVEARDD